MTQAADDLRYLKDIAQEIQERGYPALPGSLRPFLKTKSARCVAEILEQLARQNLDKKAEVARAQAAVNHLRDDMQWATDALLLEERRPKER